jgi:hypothetical protein
MIFLTGSPEIALFFDLNEPTAWAPYIFKYFHSVENCGKFGLLVSTLMICQADFMLRGHY